MRNIDVLFSNFFSNRYLDELDKSASKVGAQVRDFRGFSVGYWGTLHLLKTGPLDIFTFIAKYHPERRLGKRWERLASISSQGGDFYVDDPRHLWEVLPVVEDIRQRGYPIELFYNGHPVGQLPLFV